MASDDDVVPRFTIESDTESTVVLTPAVQS